MVACGGFGGIPLRLGGRGKNDAGLSGTQLQGTGLQDIRVAKLGTRCRLGNPEAI